MPRSAFTTESSFRMASSAAFASSDAYRGSGDTLTVPSPFKCRIDPEAKVRQYDRCHPLRRRSNNLDREAGTAHAGSRRRLSSTPLFLALSAISLEKALVLQQTEAVEAKA